jgi:hypothetical protein
VGVDCGEHDSDSFATGILCGEFYRDICLTRNLFSSIVCVIIDEKWKVKEVV